jgi:DUF4097 and DUF4098 domain-containing protein YvlB
MMRARKSLGERRRNRNLMLCLAAATVLAATVSVAQQNHKELHYTMAPGSSVYVVNQTGNITVHAANSRQAQISTTQATNKVEIDGAQNGNRVTLRTHVLQKVSGDEGRVDYDISLPSDTSINIDSENGPIKIENVQGNVTVESDAGQVDVTNVTNGAVQVQTLNGAINLNGVKNSRVSVVTTGGNVHLTGVTGPKVSVETTNGAITYDGDFAGGGAYTLMNHDGDIDVKVPASASLDLTARSVKGSVTNDFPFQKPQHLPFQLAEGRSFAGTSNSGASSVELRSFSGKIRVTKQ